MIDYKELFHIGIRVPTIEAAMQELGESLNVTWAELVEKPSQGLWTPDDGPQDIPLKFVYSCEGDQHLELLEGQSGSFWDGNENPGVHHFGVWVDDVKAETERLLGLDWELLGAAKSPAEGFGNMTYIAPSNGTILELVASINKPRFERWWGGGSFYD